MMLQSVNLLPADLLLRQQNRKVIRFWRSTACFTAFCLFTLFLAQRRDLQATEEILADSLRDTATSKQIIEETTRLQEQLRTIREASVKQKQLRSLHPPVGLLALIEQLRASFTGQVQLQSLEFEDRPQAVNNSAAPDKSSQERSGRARLTFLVPSPETAAGVLEYLKQSGRFREVNLEGTMQQQGAGSDLVFSVRCTF